MNFLVQVEGHNICYNQKYLLPIILDGISILSWQDTHGNNELITVYSILGNISQSKILNGIISLPILKFQLIKLLYRQFYGHWFWFLGIALFYSGAKPLNPDLNQITCPRGLPSFHTSSFGYSPASFFPTSLPPSLISL